MPVESRPVPFAPEVLADPIAVVLKVVGDVVGGAAGGSVSTVDFPALDSSLEAAVVAVAGGRVKRRRLAQALVDRPGVLTDGRSPAPSVVGDLLLSLRAAGIEGIAAPVCAQCGRQLRTLQRRGQDWYCAPCSPRNTGCAHCGQDKVVASLDRHGRPRCAACPEVDDRDPIQVLLTLIGALDATLPAEIVTAAIGRVFTKPTHLRRLAWAIEDHPDLLTGRGDRAPIMGVLRLIEELLDAGAQNITRPTCPGCHRQVRLHRRLNGRWHCRTCLAHSRAQPCSRCGVHREAASRDEHGRPLCPNCYITEPANQETCISCQRRRPVSTRTPDGPLCGSCQPEATDTCTICGRTTNTVISTTTGQPRCHACRRWRARCARCGTVQIVRGGTRTEPLCSTCVRPDPNFWRTCPRCGEPAAHRRHVNCRRCTLHQRLKDLLSDATGTMHPRLHGLHDHLAGHDRPDSVLAWLGKDAVATTVAELATGQRPLTHQTLDQMPASRPLQHLRSVLVATGALPSRDEHLARLEQWIAATVAQQADPDHRELLHRYAVWHVLRRLRRRLGDNHATYGQLTAAKRNIAAAVAYLDRLNSTGQDLATARQADLEAWLTENTSDSRRLAEAGNFIRWAHGQRLTTVEFPAIRWTGPTGRIDTEARWEQARRLLHDQALAPEDRAAGLLVLLYAQTAAATSRLTLDHVQIRHDDTHLRLGQQPVLLPAPVDALIRVLVDNRQGHASVGDHGTSPWLFPGGQPGLPITAAHLAKRLRQIGIHAGPARATALFQLATDLPAAVLARMLGIHISVATTWQRAAAGDWTNYAADVSRRTH